MWKKVLRNDAFCGIMPEIAAEQKGSRNPEVPADIVILFGLMKEIYGDDVDDKGLTLTRFESVELMNYSPFIYAYGKKNIALTGEGTLDGQATTGDGKDPSTMIWHQWKSSRTYNLPEGETKKIEAQNNPRTKLFGQGQIDQCSIKRNFCPLTHGCSTPSTIVFFHGKAASEPLHPSVQAIRQSPGWCSPLPKGEEDHSTSVSSV